MGVRWIEIRDEDDRWAHLVSETKAIPGRDYPFPDMPNGYKV
jgi:hypothetical protein